jgi:hypothetical protein
MPKKYKIALIILVAIGLGLYIWNKSASTKVFLSLLPLEDDVQLLIQSIFDRRNKALLEKDEEFLDALYDRTLSTGQYAYEHEMKKMNYIHIWSHKQSVKFTNIQSDVFLRKVEKRENGLYITLAVSTEYQYVYDDLPDVYHHFRIGTYHSLELIKDKDWIITKEWYSDPFSDSLDIDNLDMENVKDIIASSEKRDLSNLNERRLAALEYADKHCGVARPPDFSFHYNDKYTNYNSLGGDCTNFASQMLFEGGGFTKTGTWNYSQGVGSSAWINANAFNNYMLYSGRGSLIMKGSYEEVLKNSYNLLPGDYIGYEKKGRVAHISIVSGIDAKGYALVHSHNTDRYHVPWDLGWSNKGIIFYLVRVNY